MVCATAKSKLTLDSFADGVIVVRRTISAPTPHDAPPADWDEFERLARDALALLAAGDGPDLARLRAQLSNCTFAEMDYTGAGFFLTLEVSPSAQRLSRDGVIGDVNAESPGRESPLGVLLFVKDGRAQTLEVFAYGDWPSDIRPFRCCYVRWDVDPSGTGATAINVDARDLGSMWAAS